ncbi:MULTISPECIES: tail fiber assembly protein [Enterobacter]|uniref:tail fiber assembly protein n=1 Tax=Enterobacter TaxID=547 RepID=UPI00202043F5|nr:tail fiber assembly protein [Enterobacter roggenkampii]MCL8153509.1 tail fiber assembly protein [Enterobacter roggenkampii]MCM7560024.1 tail fiber assembly protein [Enterobacter roggenkampii]
MNTYLYDAKTNAFYPLSLRADYEAAGTWPDEGVEVEDGVFKSFQSPPAGKVRVAGSDGYPAWGDIPPPTHEELVTTAEVEKQSLIDHANDYMNGKQWPGKAAMGRLKDSEKVQYNAWLDYLEALEIVDTSTSPDITWPDPPAE